MSGAAGFFNVWYRHSLVFALFGRDGAQQPQGHVDAVILFVACFVLSLCRNLQFCCRGVRLCVQLFSMFLQCRSLLVHGVVLRVRWALV